MAEQATITLKLKDLATKGVERAKAAIDKYRKAGEDAGSSTSRLSQASKALSGSLGAMAAGAGVAAAGFVMVASALTALYKVTHIATEAADAYQFAEAQLDAAIRRTAKTSAEAVKMKKDLIETSKRLALSTGEEESAVQVLIAGYVKMGKSAEEAGKMASLAYDISGRTGMEAAKASESLAKVMRGNVGSFADLTDATKAEEDALNKMTSAGERTEFMLGILGERFAGGTSEIQGTQVATNNLINAKTRLVAMMGRAIDESGVFGAILSPLTDKLTKLGDKAEGSRDQLKDFALMVGKGVVKSVGVATKVILGLVTGAKLAGIGFKGLAIVGSIAMSELMRIVAKMSSATVSAFGDITASMDRLLEGLESIARATGNVKMIKMATEAREALQGISKSSKDLAKSLTGDVKLMEGTTAALKQELEGIGKATELALGDLATGIRKIDEMEGKALANIKKRRDALKTDKPTDNAFNQRNKLQARLASLAKHREAKQQALMRQRLVIIQLETRLLRTKNEEEKIALRFMIAQNKVKLSSASIEFGALRTATLKKGMEEAEINRQKELLDLANLRLGKDVEAADKRLELQKELAENDAQMREEFAASIGGLGSAFDGMVESSSRGLKQIGTGLQGLATLGADVSRVVTESAKGSTEGALASAKALSTAGQSMSGFAQMMGASATAQAAILALFETGASVASFAAGDIFGGTQHALAAGTFAAVAGKSATTSGGAAGGGGSASTGSPATPTQSTREAAELFAEELAGQLGGGGQGQQIVLNFDGAQIYSPETLIDHVAESAAAQGYDLLSNLRGAG